MNLRTIKKTQLTPSLNSTLKFLFFPQSTLKNVVNNATLEIHTLSRYNDDKKYK